MKKLHDQSTHTVLLISTLCLAALMSCSSSKNKRESQPIKIEDRVPCGQALGDMPGGGPFCNGAFTEIVTAGFADNQLPILAYSSVAPEGERWSNALNETLRVAISRPGETDACGINASHGERMELINGDRTVEIFDWVKEAGGEYQHYGYWHLTDGTDCGNNGNGCIVDENDILRRFDSRDADAMENIGSDVLTNMIGANIAPEDLINNALVRDSRLVGPGTQTIYFCNEGEGELRPILSITRAGEGLRAKHMQGLIYTDNHVSKVTSADYEKVEGKWLRTWNISGHDTQTLTVTDPDGYPTILTFDGSRLSTVKYHTRANEENKVTYHYNMLTGENAFDLITSITDADGKSTTLDYVDGDSGYLKAMHRIDIDVYNPWIAIEYLSPEQIGAYHYSPSGVSGGSGTAESGKRGIKITRGIAPQSADGDQTVSTQIWIYEDADAQRHWSGKPRVVMLADGKGNSSNYSYRNPDHPYFVNTTTPKTALHTVSRLYRTGPMNGLPKSTHTGDRHISIRYNISPATQGKIRIDRVVTTATSDSYEDADSETPLVRKQHDYDQRGRLIGTETAIPERPTYVEEFEYENEPYGSGFGQLVKRRAGPEDKLQIVGSTFEYYVDGLPLVVQPIGGKAITYHYADGHISKVTQAGTETTYNFTDVGFGEDGWMVTTTKHANGSVVSVEKRIDSFGVLESVVNTTVGGFTRSLRNVPFGPIASPLGVTTCLTSAVGQACNQLFAHRPSNPATPVDPLSQCVLPSLDDPDSSRPAGPQPYILPRPPRIAAYRGQNDLAEKNPTFGALRNLVNRIEAAPDCDRVKGARCAQIRNAESWTIQIAAGDDEHERLPSEEHAVFLKPTHPNNRCEACLEWQGKTIGLDWTFAPSEEYITFWDDPEWESKHSSDQIRIYQPTASIPSPCDDEDLEWRVAIHWTEGALDSTTDDACTVVAYTVRREGGDTPDDQSDDRLVKVDEYTIEPHQLGERSELLGRTRTLNSRQRLNIHHGDFADEPADGGDPLPVKDRPSCVAATDFILIEGLPEVQEDVDIPEACDPEKPTLGRHQEAVCNKALTYADPMGNGFYSSAVARNSDPPGQPISGWYIGESQEIIPAKDTSAPDPVIELINWQTGMHETYDPYQINTYSKKGVPLTKERLIRVSDTEYRIRSTPSKNTVVRHTYTAQPTRNNRILLSLVETFEKDDLNLDSDLPNPGLIDPNIHLAEKTNYSYTTYETKIDHTQWLGFAKPIKHTTLVEYTYEQNNLTRILIRQLGLTVAAQYNIRHGTLTSASAVRIKFQCFEDSPGECSKHPETKQPLLTDNVESTTVDEDTRYSFTYDNNDRLRFVMQPDQIGRVLTEFRYLNGDLQFIRTNNALKGNPWRYYHYINASDVNSLTSAIDKNQLPADAPVVMSASGFGNNVDWSYDVYSPSYMTAPTRILAQADALGAVVFFDYHDTYDALTDVTDEMGQTLQHVSYSDRTGREGLPTAINDPVSGQATHLYYDDPDSVHPTEVVHLVNGERVSGTSLVENSRGRVEAHQWASHPDANNGQVSMFTEMTMDGFGRPETYKLNGHLKLKIDYTKGTVEKNEAEENTVDSINVGIPGIADINTKIDALMRPTQQVVSARGANLETTIKTNYSTTGVRSIIDVFSSNGLKHKTDFSDFLNEGVLPTGYEVTNAGLHGEVKNKVTVSGNPGDPSKVTEEPQTCSGGTCRPLAKRSLDYLSLNSNIGGGWLEAGCSDEEGNDPLGERHPSTVDQETADSLCQKLNQGSTQYVDEFDLYLELCGRPRYKDEQCRDREYWLIVRDPDTGDCEGDSVNNWSGVLQEQSIPEELGHCADDDYHVPGAGYFDVGTEQLPTETASIDAYVHFDLDDDPYRDENGEIDEMKYQCAVIRETLVKQPNHYYYLDPNARKVYPLPSCELDDEPLFVGGIDIPFHLNNRYSLWVGVSDDGGQTWTGVGGPSRGDQISLYQSVMEHSPRARVKRDHFNCASALKHKLANATIRVSGWQRNFLTQEGDWPVHPDFFPSRDFSNEDYNCTDWETLSWREGQQRCVSVEPIWITYDGSRQLAAQDSSSFTYWAYDTRVGRTEDYTSNADESFATQVLFNQAIPSQLGQYGEIRHSESLAVYVGGFHHVEQNINEGVSHDGWGCYIGISPSSQRELSEGSVYSGPLYGVGNSTMMDSATGIYLFGLNTYIQQPHLEGLEVAKATKCTTSMGSNDPNCANQMVVKLELN